MKSYDFENKYPDSDLGRKQYDAAMDNSNGGKGVHLQNDPYLWGENNPVDPVFDTPVENFIPTPTINAGDESTKGKKALKIGLLVAFIAFMVYAFIAILIESPEVFGLGDIGPIRYF